MYSYRILRKVNQVSRVFVRYKNPPDHWSVLRKKIHPIDKALAHFDDFYKQVFKKKWPSIREGLLGKQKYVAIVNNYGENEETMAKLEMEGALNIRTLFTLEKEHIREQIEKNQRNAALEKIWSLDNEIEDLNNVDQQVEKKSEENKTDAYKYSLQASLDTAELDSRRLIDTKEKGLALEILNEYIPATKLKGKDDFILESSHYQMFDPTTSFPVEREHDIHFPENLNIYCFEQGNFSDFNPAKKAITGVLNYYLMDGGSILPILALDLKPGCSMLDMCAAPGGKSLLALQTLYPERLVSNDVSNSRVTRIENVYQQFLYDLDERWLTPGRVKLTNLDGRFIEMDDFDRILVDVPCTTDRHSLKENDNNIFKPSRIKERLKLPELQSELLFNALTLAKKGGIVVYSTCSLSPIQNDGVVSMALKKLWEQTKMQYVVKDLTPALLQTRRVFHLADQKLLKYGHLVLPQKRQNYGPTYFCKLKRIK
ncbi:5-methylcytosine rRNA methyltransferase NSUN4 [Euwallacea fornicatus]|uniref:5-methylcytosine rRNA methyltransferase NSUN4 n=1 Tax=Euwallacea fornicatus TaxID=995702 RepID=UPI00338F579D